MDYDWSRHAPDRPFKEFTTVHVTGEPMTISSLAQLRAVERQHGVNFPAFGDTSLDKKYQMHSETTWIDREGKTRRE